MPPPTRFWVILIGKTPTSFHAKEREDLLPTLRQLQRTQKDVSLRWFERGKVWESPDAAEGAAKLAATEAREKRTKDWRPGGEHRDPKARFEMTRDQKRAKFKRDQRGGGGGGGEDGPPSPFGPRPPRPGRPPFDRPKFDRPSGDRRPSEQPSGRPFQDRPPGARPFKDRPSGGRPFKDRPAEGRPFKDRPSGDRPFGQRPFGDRPPRRDRPAGPPMENPFGPRKPRAERPPFDRSRSDRPGRPPGRPPAGRGGGFKPPKRRS
jgi:23S rRNA pseudouridine2605 synthase